MKFPDAAKAGIRCKWCKNLKQGTCSGCGQVYGHPNSRAPVARRRSGSGVVVPSSPAVVGSPVPSFTGNARSEAAETPVQARSMGTDAADVTWEPVKGPMKILATSIWGRDFAITETAKDGVIQVTFTLPAPPSANRWWRIAGSRMHLSHEAKDYKAMAFAAAGVKGQPLFPTQNLTVIVVWHRDRAAGDLDKRLGVLLDALQSIKKRIPAPTPQNPKAKKWLVLAPGVYDNDSQVVQIWARRCDDHPEIPKGSVRIEVCALP